MTETNSEQDEGGTQAQHVTDDALKRGLSTGEMMAGEEPEDKTSPEGE